MSEKLAKHELDGMSNGYYLIRYLLVIGPWCNGSTTGFGPVCRGSNPCGPATLHLFTLPVTELLVSLDF